MSDYKRMAARRAVELVEDGMVVGLGGGSTAALAIELLATLVRLGRLTGVTGVPCAESVARLARRLGIPLTSLEEHPLIDLTIDGADEVDPSLRLIKGAGGALLREKIVAQASSRLVIVVDDSKLSPALGAKRALPLEVLPFGWSSQSRYLESLGGRPRLRRDESSAPLLTDNGNYLIECDFGPMADPEHLATLLEKRAGIIEHGLFLGLATDVIVAGPAGIEHRLSAMER